MPRTRRARAGITAIAMLALSCAWPAGTAAAQADDCARSVLAALGWRFHEEARLSAPRIEAGAPCMRASLEAAQAAGDLRVAVPRGFDTAGLGALYRTLFAHPATTCAYAFRLGDATRRAVDKLVANDGYRFTALQAGWIGFGVGGSARDGWRPIASFGRGYVPRDGNWRAIEGFYQGHVRTECGVGRQVAQYAAQAELYGPRGFDAAFAADELVIGRWHVLNRSDSVLQGARAGAYTRDGDARQASALGRQAFVGVPGFLEHTLPRRYLDDVNNQAQNFVVYDVDDAAAAALRAQGGFAHFNEKMRGAWEASRVFPQVRHPHHFQRLLLEGDGSLREGLSEPERSALARIDALLGDAFFTGFRVYVHHEGVRPLRDHVVRMLDRNPRTPFHVAFALHNVHTTLRDRYMDFLRAECAAGRAP